MNIIDHEYYVSLEVAKLLKEAGFDWETEFGQHIWDSSKRLETNRNFNSEKYLVSLPTLDVAQRWLREEHYFHIVVEYDSWNYFCRIDQCEPVCLYKHREWVHNCKEFSTYEEAQEAGIKKALEIILKKGE